MEHSDFRLAAQPEFQALQQRFGYGFAEEMMAAGQRDDAPLAPTRPSSSCWYCCTAWSMSLCLRICQVRLFSNRRIRGLLELDLALMRDVGQLQRDRFADEFVEFLDVVLVIGCE